MATAKPVARGGGVVQARERLLLPEPAASTPMSKLLMKLRHVPEDEVEEVRALLADHHIDYFETPADRWGVSLPAIWVTDEAQWPRARRLLEDYQRERQVRVRAALREARERGEPPPTLLDNLLAHPLQALLYLALIALVLYLSLAPFLILA